MHGSTIQAHAQPGLTFRPITPRAGAYSSSAAAFLSHRPQPVGQVGQMEGPGKFFLETHFPDAGNLLPRAT